MEMPKDHSCIHLQDTGLPFVYLSFSSFVHLSNKHLLCASFASGSVEIVKDREAWRAAVHGVTKSQT